MKTKKYRVKDNSLFIFFNFTKTKIVIDVILSLFLVILGFSLIPFVRDIFLEEGTQMKLIDILINTFVFMFFLYPVSCFVSLLISRRKEIKEEQKASEKGKKLVIVSVIIEIVLEIIFYFVFKTSYIYYSVVTSIARMIFGMLAFIGLIVWTFCKFRKRGC